MKSPPSRRIAPFLFVTPAALLLGAGCSTAPLHRAGVRDETVHRMTLGTVQKDLHLGMSSADVLAVLGPPNIVATDDQRREVWTYDKKASKTSGLTLYLFDLISEGQDTLPCVRARPTVGWRRRPNGAADEVTE